MRYDALSQAWIEVDNDDLMTARTLPEGIGFRLWLEAREVQLKTHEENLAALEREDAQDESDDKEKDENNKKDPRTPQIALLSSGDTTPFELHLQRAGSPVRWRIASQPDNTLIAEAMEDE